MARTLRHMWDIVTLLTEHKDGLTLDQIVDHFLGPQLPNNTAPHKLTLEYDRRLRLRVTIDAYLRKLQVTGEVLREDDVYKANFALAKDGGQ